MGLVEYADSGDYVLVGPGFDKCRVHPGGAGDAIIAGRFADCAADPSKRVTGGSVHILASVSGVGVRLLR